MDLSKKPGYGNWVSNRLVSKCMILSVLFIIVDTALCIFTVGLTPLKVFLALVAAFFIVSTVYFYYARWLFSKDGGDIQNKILNLLISYIDWDGAGKAIDIGCGSGALTIEIARKYSHANLTGIDYWGSGWDYSKKQCEENAYLEGVSDRAEFVRTSASKLPFADETFDLAISNLAFHEVKDSKNKIDLIREALRVVKKGGKFVFQDLFLLKTYYGTPDELVDAVKAAGVKDVHFVNTSTSPFIPKALKLPFMAGTLGLIYGEK